MSPQNEPESDQSRVATSRNSVSKGAHGIAERGATHPQIFEKKSGSKPLLSLGERVVACLQRHGCKTESEKSIREWLVSFNNGRLCADRLKHTIAQWPDHEPQLASLVEIARLAGLSLDEMIGHKPNLSAAHKNEVLKAGKEWLGLFMAQCENLSCYVVVTEVAKIEHWRKHIEDQRTAKGSAPSAADKVSLAAQWAKEICVFDASLRLRREHALLTREAVQKQSLSDLLEHRIGWTRRVAKHGPSLADAARDEAYLGIYAVIAMERCEDHERYPCVDPKESDGGPAAEKSLRVRFDVLPWVNGEVAWVIYYLWGPALTRDRVSALLPQKTRKSRRPTRRPS